MSNQSFGKTGEELACKYLKNHKYKIIERNFTTDIGEIDIIAQKDNCIIFVEVKTRMSGKFGLPREAVGYFKQKKYSQVAMQYIKHNNLFKTACRFDVIEILGEEINHIENAFSFIK